MSESVSPVSGRQYGLATVCRVWRLARSGVYRHLTPSPSTPPGRPGPTGAMPDDTLLAAIRAVLAADARERVVGSDPGGSPTGAQGA